MTTQLETIIAALEKNGEPMTASQLADTLRENGTGAARPENTVLSLVHKCRDIVNMGGSPSKYGLREWLKDGTAPLDPGDGFGALEAFCAQLRPDAKFCRTEADVREKLVIPVHAGILTDGIRWRFFFRTVRSGIPDADLFHDGSIDRPDKDLMDVFSDFSGPLFNNDILKTNASRMMTDLQKKSKKA